MHRSFSRALICRLAGIPERIGHYTRKRSFLLTQKILPPKKDSLHRIDYYLDVIEKAGLKVEDRYTDFYISQEDADFVADFLSRNKINPGDFLVVVNPGGNWISKRWPKEHWAQLSDMLIEDYGAKVVITGGHNDVNLAKHITDMMKSKPLLPAVHLISSSLGRWLRKLRYLLLRYGRCISQTASAQKNSGYFH